MRTRLTVRQRTWILAGLILVTAIYTRFLSNVTAVPLKRPLSEIPSVVGPWREVRAEQMDGRILEIVGVEDYLWKEYRNGASAPVSVYVGYYEQQREGDQIHSPKHCLPGSGWQPLESTVIRFDTPGFNGSQTRANRYVVAKGQERQLAFYWYQSRGRDIVNEYAAKMWMVIDSIFRKRNDGSLIRLMTPIAAGETTEQAQERVISFSREFLPELAKMLPD